MATSTTERERISGIAADVARDATGFTSSIPRALAAYRAARDCLESGGTIDDARAAAAEALADIDSA